MALPASVLGTASPPCAPAVVRMTTPVPGLQPAAGVRVVQPPCRASCSRAVSPTFRSNLPFGDTGAGTHAFARSATPVGGAASPGTAHGPGMASEPAAACLQRFFHSSSRARVHPPKTTSLVPQELPQGPSDILEDRGRRHFSPPPGASRGMMTPLSSAAQSNPAALPPGCTGPAREGAPRAAGVPSPPRFRQHGSMSPRGASNSPAPADGSPRTEVHHQSSAGVMSCMRGDLADRQHRAVSPHLQSSSVRGLLQDDDSRGHIGEEQRDVSAARSRWSPRRSPSRRVPRPGPAQAAGMSQTRNMMVGTAAAEGSPISASSAKEMQIEADSLELRAGVASGLSPRSPRVHQDASMVPMIGDLSCHELRHMGKAVAEANLRTRGEHFHQAPPATGRPRSPVRSSLKKAKGGSASAGPPSARGGANHTGTGAAGHERPTSRRGAASSATSGAATPTPATRAPDAAALPQAALVALRAEIVQRSASGATLAPAASMGSLHDAPHGATSQVSLGTAASMGSLHEAPHGAASASISSCSTQTPPSTATAFRMTNGGAGEEKKAELEERIQSTDHRITELRAEIEQLRFRRGGSPDPALGERGETVERQRSATVERQRSTTVERQRSAKEERAAGPPQVNRMVTPQSSRGSAPPCLPRTPHRQVSSDEAIVLVTSARPPTPHRQISCPADDVAIVATSARAEVDHRRGVVAEVSNRVRFDDVDELDEAELEQTCRRRWESPKPGPGTPLPPGMNHAPSAFYTMPSAISETPAAPTALNVPVPAIAATGASGSAVKRSSSGEAAGMDAALEAELANVKRRHEEALQAEMKRVRQQHQRRLELERDQHQAKGAAAKGPRTSHGGA
mmetsp:Transcript_134402/g.245277  ORF Transcript_134402/g.245277 Transcript_134402/m.245277 type:complete len:856 (-) Transcript_134402:200-2767(-)